jgi:hypothetical protein
MDPRKSYTRSFERGIGHQLRVHHPQEPEIVSEWDGYTQEYTARNATIISQEQRQEELTQRASRSRTTLLERWLGSGNILTMIVSGITSVLQTTFRLASYATNVLSGGSIGRPTWRSVSVSQIRAGEQSTERLLITAVSAGENASFTSIPASSEKKTGGKKTVRW